MANCNYKVNLTDIQNKYKFNIFAMGGYNDSDLRKMIESVFYALPRTAGTGTSVTLNDTAFSYMKNKLNATDTSQDSTTGKNKLKIKDTSNGGLITKVNTDGSISVSGTASATVAYLDTGESASISAGALALSIQSTISVPLRITLYNGSTNMGTMTISAGQTSTTTTTSQELTDYNVYLYNLVVGTSYNFTIYPMLESGSSPTSWEPYTNGASPNPDYPQTIHTITGNNKVKSSNSDNSLSNSVLLTLGDTEICKIGTYEDKIFKAIKGDEIYDSLSDVEKATLDYGKWYLRKNTGKVDLGTIDWIYQGGRFYTGEYVDYIVKNPDGSTIANVFCYKYTAISPATWYAKTTKGISIGVTGYAGDSNILVYDSDYTSSASFKTAMSGNYLYYQSKTPTNIKFNDIIQEQLEDIYNNMLSYEGTTNISQENADLPFNITSTAIKDLNNL